MKKWMFTIALLLAGTVFARVNMLEFQAGYLNPKGTAGGFIFGGNYGIVIDESVDISFGVAYFSKQYRQNTEVGAEDYESGVNETTVITELEYSTTLLPVSANATVHLPIGPPLYLYASGSLSYQFLFNTENNYEEGIKEKRFYSGFGWMARAGLEYAIGSRSSILVEAIYNNCKVRGNKDKRDGLPVWNEVDVSGFGFRAGLKVEIF